MTHPETGTQGDWRPSDYGVDAVNDWCAGCGDFGILRALQQALAGLQLAPDDVAVFGGIGCSGKTPHYLATYGVHTLHGRLLPFATGAKLANPDLTVVAVGGDGDGLGIGAGHFVAAGRRNLDITYILFNNGVYGLTKGQAAPTLRHGEQTKAMSQASLLAEVNPVMLALSAGFSWIGRGYAYQVGELQELMQAAIRHRGSAFLEVLQPCPVYNDLHDKNWFAGKDTPAQRPRLYALQETGYDPVLPRDSDDVARAEVMARCVARALEWGERIPLGVFFQDLSRAEFIDQLRMQQPGYALLAPCRQPVLMPDGCNSVDLGAIYQTLRVW